MLMAMIDLSIVIPAYNVEKYLAVCLDSLLAAEGIEGTEIIIVDDGSTDDTLKIVGEYSDNYKNIRLISKENGGPSAARNLGLNEASGKYVFFCDSDDEVVPELFSRVISMTEETDVDVIMWDSDLIYENRSYLVNNNRGFFSHEGLEKVERVYTGKEFVGTLLENSGNFVCTVWLGAYRKDYLVDSGFFFEAGLIHEDELWVPRVLLNAETVFYYPVKLYNYRVHKGSIMNPGSHDRKKHVDSLMQIYPSLYGYFDEVIEDDHLRRLLEGNLTKKYLHMIYKFHVVKYGYSKKIDKRRLWRTALRIRDKVMILLLYIVSWLPGTNN